MSFDKPIIICWNIEPFWAEVKPERRDAQNGRVKRFQYSSEIRRRGRFAIGPGNSR